MVNHTLNTPGRVVLHGSFQDIARVWSETEYLRSIPEEALRVFSLERELSLLCLGGSQFFLPFFHPPL